MATKKRSVSNSLTSRGVAVTCYISYSESDGRHYATRLGERLRASGVSSVLPDREIPAGANWVEALRDAIDLADALILVGTPSALASKWVAEEVEHFLRRGSRVIPIIFRGASSFDEVPIFLRGIRWLQEDPSALRKGPSSEAIVRLVEAVKWVGSEGRRDRPKGISARARAEKRPLNEGKLILVGRGEVGKTSLVKRVVENDFNGDESKTQGINITTWSLPHDTDTFRLNIWDFGGQEIMHATQQFFLTERSLYLLVLNGREGGEDVDAEYWLKHIESFGGESPVIVVQNKIAQHPFDLNYRGLQARYPQIRGFVKTDCKDEIGLPELRELVESVVGGMP